MCLRGFFVFTGSDAVFAVRPGSDFACIEGVHALDHPAEVLHAGGLIAGVHRQLRQADVEGVDGHMRAGNIAQRGAAQQIGAVGEVLHRYACVLAELVEHRCRDAVRGVLLVGVELDDDALVHLHLILLVGVLRMVGMGGGNPTGFWKAVYEVCTGAGTGWTTVVYCVIYALLILGFSFFYTLIVFNPVEVANNLKKNGGFIPGIRAGKPTAEYLQGVLNKITLFGAIFIAFIAIFPVIAQAITGITLGFGGTALLIVVGVALELVKQLEAQLVMKHYKGFLD